MLSTSTNKMFTSNQKHALDSSRNLGVRANAGSGKTSVLVDRIMQILEINRPSDPNEFTPDPVPKFSIRNIVSITFTKKAAGELKARLMRLLQEIEAQREYPVKEWWKTQITFLEESPIGTIDGFFGSILREYALYDESEDRIDPDFQMLDPFDAQELKKLAVQTVLELNHEGMHSGLKEAVAWWKRLDGTQVLSENLYKLMDHSAGVNAIIIKNPNMKAEDEAKERVKADPAYVKLQNEQEKNKLLEMLGALVAKGRGANRPTNTLTKLINDSENAIQKLNEKVEGNEIETINFLEKMLLTDGKARKFRGCDEVEEEIDALHTSWGEALAAKRIDLNLEEQSVHARNYLMVILREVNQTYLKICLEKNSYDFDTVARRVLRLFASYSTIAKDLKDRYRFIQIDEFQDTSRLQWDILSYLVGNGPDEPLDKDRLFIVGDPQQSIYGFRQADVAVFSEVSEKIKLANQTNELHQVQTLYEQKSGEVAAKDVRLGDVKLSENFRTLAISPLGFFNKLFTSVFDLSNEAAIDLTQSYQVKFQQLIAGRDKNSKGEVICLDYQVDETDEEADGLSIGQVKMIAEELIRKKGQPRIKVANGQFFSWKDMAILVPSRNETLTNLENHLRSLGIPYLMHGGVGFWQRQEILDLMQLCQSLSQPGNDLALLGVLRGPCLRCNDADLFFFHCLGRGRMPRGLSILCSEDLDLKKACKFDKLVQLSDADFYDLSNTWNEFSNEDRQRLVRAAKAVGLEGDWRLLVDRVSHTDLLKHCLEQSGAYAIYASLPDGDQALANLDKFFEFLRTEESKPGSSLAKIAIALEERVAASNRDSQANPDSQGTDAVQIMTIHASKGLEFPLVIVANMQRKIVRNQTESILVNQQGQVGLRIRHSDSPRVNFPDSQYEMIKNEIENRETAESRRLFYVAATRAEEVLVLAGNKPKINNLSWRKWFFKALELEVGDANFSQGYWEEGGLRVTLRTKLIAKQDHVIEDVGPREATEDLNQYYETPQLISIPVTRVEANAKLFDEDVAEWLLRNRHYVLRHYNPPTFVDEKADDKQNRESKKNLGTLVGTIVHRAMERQSEWFQKSVQDQKAWLASLVDIEISLALNELEEDDQAFSLSSEEVTSIKETVANLLDVSSNKEIAKLIEERGKVEIEFLLPLAGWVVNGRLDKLVNRDGIFEVIDWKTDGGSAETSIAHHQFQMKLYALAVLRCCVKEKQEQQKSICASLVLLNHKLVHQYEFSAEELKQFEKELMEKFRAMKEKLLQELTAQELETLVLAN